MDIKGLPIKISFGFDGKLGDVTVKFLGIAIFSHIIRTQRRDLC